MIVRRLMARLVVLVAVGLLRLAVALGGVGRYDIEIGVCPMDPEPVWCIVASIVGLPIFWFVIVVFFAATGDM